MAMKLQVGIVAQPKNLQDPASLIRARANKIG